MAIQNTNQVLNTGVTGIGLARYPHLSTPDTKFDAEGNYQVQLECPLKDQRSQQLLQAIEAGMEIALEEAKKKGARSLRSAQPPFIIDVEKDTVTFKFKSKATITTKDGQKIPRSIPIVDTKNTPIPKSVTVNYDSKLCVAWTVDPFYTSLVGAGVALRIRAVQLVALGKAYDANKYGFDTIDGEDFSNVSQNQGVEFDIMEAEETTVKQQPAKASSSFNF
jgi:hypothetical protein